MLLIACVLSSYTHPSVTISTKTRWNGEQKELFHRITSIKIFDQTRLMFKPFLTRNFLGKDQQMRGREEISFQVFNVKVAKLDNIYVLAQFLSIHRIHFTAVLKELE